MENDGESSGEKPEGEDSGKKWRIKKIYIAVIAYCVIRLALVVQVVSFDGNAIPVMVFSQLEGIFPKEMMPSRFGNGTVLGNHVLETEYGEITLKNYAKIWKWYDSSVVDIKNFRWGLASHNLVVEGIEIPPDVSVTLGASGYIGLGLNEDIMVYGIIFSAGGIYIGDSDYSADVVMTLSKHENIVLEDGTQIQFIQTPASGGSYTRRLYIYLADKRWEIEGRNAVKLPGETEFTMYRSITFEPDWGAFISGELLEK